MYCNLLYGDGPRESLVSHMVYDSDPQYLHPGPPMVTYQLHSNWIEYKFVYTAETIHVRERLFSNKHT